jgi:hypothetical protein
LRELARATYAEFDAGAAADPVKPLLVDPKAYGENYSNIKGFRAFGSIPMTCCLPFTEALCAALERTAMPPSISAWLGGRAGLSLNASSVRLSELDAKVRRVFHQDGNFLGGVAAQTLNCWIALDPCGKDAPGLEVFPRRMDRLLAAGTEGSVVKWEIDETLVYRELGVENRWIPEFNPGDAFVFDHLHVHRTYVTDSMIRNRHAIECWMFPTLEVNRSMLLAWLENA